MVTHSVPCPACDVASCGPAMRHPGLPGFLFPMAKEFAGGIESADLNLHLCPECGHLFQPTIDMDLLARIYGDYYANYPYDGDDAMNAAYRRPFHLFADLMLDTFSAGPKKKLLEIGCSRPENMLPFAEKGFECVGIDPSPLADAVDAPQGVRVVSGYYEDTPVVGPVDAIVSRFNLEHITDLSAYVTKMHNDLRDGGRVIVQVPNMDYYLENQQPLFVAHEHIHYFSERSLRALFGLYGFVLIASYSAGQPSVLACFEKKTSASAAPPGPALEIYKANIAAKADDLANQLVGRNRVVFYGCGLALYWVLTVLRDRLPPQVIVTDDNPLLQGRALPVHGFPIHRPDPDLLADADLVVLTLNPIYHDRVVARLRALGRPLTLLKIGTVQLEQEILP